MLVDEVRGTGHPVGLIHQARREKRMTGIREERR